MILEYSTDYSGYYSGEIILEYSEISIKYLMSGSGFKPIFQNLGDILDRFEYSRDYAEETRNNSRHYSGKLQDLEMFRF